MPTPPNLGSSTELDFNGVPSDIPVIFNSPLNRASNPNNLYYDPKLNQAKLHARQQQEAVNRSMTAYHLQPTPGSTHLTNSLHQNFPHEMSLLSQQHHQQQQRPPASAVGAIQVPSQPPSHTPNARPIPISQANIARRNAFVPGMQLPMFPSGPVPTTNSNSGGGGPPPQPHQLQFRQPPPQSQPQHPAASKPPPPPSSDPPPQHQHPVPGLYGGPLAMAHHPQRSSSLSLPTANPETPTVPTQTPPRRTATPQQPPPSQPSSQYAPLNQQPGSEFQLTAIQQRARMDQLTSSNSFGGGGRRTPQSSQGLMTQPPAQGPGAVHPGYPLGPFRTELPQADPIAGPSMEPQFRVPLQHTGFIAPGRCTLRLMEFTSHLAQATPRCDFNWWQSFANVFLLHQADSHLKLRLKGDAGEVVEKRLEMMPPLISRFFHSAYESGVYQIQISFSHPKELPLSPYETFVECSEATWTWAFASGWLVTMRGRLSGHVQVCNSSGVPLPEGGLSMGGGATHLKFRSIEFWSEKFDRYLHFNRVHSNSNIVPPNPVNQFGLPLRTFAVLDLAESINDMADLIRLSHAEGLNPFETLTEYNKSQPKPDPTQPPLHLQQQQQQQHRLMMTMQPRLNGIDLSTLHPLQPQMQLPMQGMPQRQLQPSPPEPSSSTVPSLAASTSTVVSSVSGSGSGGNNSAALESSMVPMTGFSVIHQPPQSLTPHPHPHPHPHPQIQVPSTPTNPPNATPQSSPKRKVAERDEERERERKRQQEREKQRPPEPPTLMMQTRNAKARRSPVAKGNAVGTRTRKRGGTS